PATPPIRVRNVLDDDDLLILPDLASSVSAPQSENLTNNTFIPKSSSIATTTEEQRFVTHHSSSSPLFSTTLHNRLERSSQSAPSSDVPQSDSRIHLRRHLLIEDDNDSTASTPPRQRSPAPKITQIYLLDGQNTP